MEKNEKRRRERMPVDVGAMVGECLDGRFELVRRIGEGGYGAVFEAIQLSVQRRCAVKVLAAELGCDELSRRRFEVEAKATAELRHPNTVTVFDFGVDEETGALFLVMELLEGQTLQEMVTERGLQPVRMAVRILEAAAGSLQEAHDKGVIHRDIKPHNIMCTHPEGLADDVSHVPIKVIDFGIAKSVCADEESSGISVPASGLTRTGMMVGTPTYMSPEQIRGNEIDGRVDQYALAMTAYWMIAGRTPYSGSTALEVASRHLTEPVLPLTTYRPELQVPPAFEEVLIKALAKDPEERYARIEEFAAECRETLDWAGELGDEVGEQRPSEVAQTGGESGETAAIRRDESRRTPTNLERTATGETARTRVVGGKANGGTEQSRRIGANSGPTQGERHRRRAAKGVWARAMGEAWRSRWSAGGAAVLVAVLGITAYVSFRGTWNWMGIGERGGEVAERMVDERVRRGVRWKALGIVERAVSVARMGDSERRASWVAFDWPARRSNASNGSEASQIVPLDVVQSVEPAVDESTSVEPAALTVRMIPWGSLYIDGSMVGEGSHVQMELEPGRHRVVMRQGPEVVRDVTVEVESGDARVLDMEAN